MITVSLRNDCNEFSDMKVQGSPMDEAFIEHYQLTDDPFAARSAAFQFYKPKRRSVLEQLIHFARYGQFLLVVSGPPGAGKTVLRHAVVAACKEQTHNIVLTAANSRDASSVALQVAHGINSQTNDIIGLLHAIELMSLTGKDVHILVDDAHLLDESALHLLQRLVQGNGVARARLFLFAEPALLNRLDEQAELEESPEYHLVELEPWSAEEMRGYLSTRLEAAGQDLDLFTEQELEDIYARSGGWPGAINQVAKDVLIAAMTEPAVPVPRAPFPYKQMIALLVVAFLFILAWYLPDEPSKPQAPTAELNLPSSSTPATVVVDSERQGASTQRIVLDLTQEEDVREPVQQHVQQPEPSVPPPTQAPIPPAPVQPLETETAQVAAIEPAPAEPEPAQPPAQPPAVVAPAPTPAEPAIAANVAAAKAEAKAEVKPKPKPEPKPEPKPVAKPAPAPAPTPKAASEKPKVAEAVAARAGNNEADAAWYRQQPKQQFTLQLFATANERTARQFVQANGSAAKYFRKTHQGRALYVVTYGSYASREAAVAAEEKLPASVRSNKPWVRTMGAIQQEIR